MFGASYDCPVLLLNTALFHDCSLDSTFATSSHPDTLCSAVFALTSARLWELILRICPLRRHSFAIDLASFQYAYSSSAFLAILLSRSFQGVCSSNNKKYGSTVGCGIARDFFLLVDIDASSLFAI